MDIMQILLSVAVFLIVILLLVDSYFDIAGSDQEALGDEQDNNE